MYYVSYVNRQTQERETREFATLSQAKNYYMINIGNMAYGYISDDESLDMGEEVMNIAEEEIARRVEEMRQDRFGAEDNRDLGHWSLLGE